MSKRRVSCHAKKVDRLEDQCARVFGKVVKGARNPSTCSCRVSSHGTKHKAGFPFQLSCNKAQSRLSLSNQKVQKGSRKMNSSAEKRMNGSKQEEKRVVKISQMFSLLCVDHGTTTVLFALQVGCDLPYSLSLFLFLLYTLTHT